MIYVYIIVAFLAGLSTGCFLVSRHLEKKILAANRSWQQTVDDLIDIVGTYLTTEDLR